MKFFGGAILAFLTALSGGVLAQAQSAQGTAAPHSQVAGTVTAVDAQANQVSLKSDKGDAIAVTTTEKTLILHLPPGETDVPREPRWLFPVSAPVTAWWHSTVDPPIRRPSKPPLW